MDKFSLKKENYNSLDDLFSEWKERHSEECESSYEKTAPKSKNEKCIPNYNDFKNSFCPDGYVGDENKAELLFICRESNVDGNAEINDEFWFKKISKMKKTKYYWCTNLIADKFGLYLCECAYMNINKRGGYGSCDSNQLKEYATLYEDYILKEIELINPKKVVILGGLRDEIVEIIMKSEREIYKYPYHPCVYRKAPIEQIKEYKI